MTKKIIVVREADMNASELFVAMKEVSPQRLGKIQKLINLRCEEREAYEAGRERMVKGISMIAQSPDIRFINALKDNESFARLVVAKQIDVTNYITPHAKDGGKLSTETSNLKAYEKVRQIAETIHLGRTDIQNVAKVFAVCAYRFAKGGKDILTREFCENFLTSYELNSLDEGTAELWSAIDEIRAKQMTGGAATQSGQMVRTLVAMNEARDVKEGRLKNVQIDVNGSVLNALMLRFGQSV